MVWLLNVKLGAVQSTYYMVKSYRFKFPNFRIGPCGISAQLRAEAQNDLRKSHDMLRKCTDRAEFPHH